LSSGSALFCVCSCTPSELYVLVFAQEELKGKHSKSNIDSLGADFNMYFIDTSIVAVIDYCLNNKRFLVALQ
jgi:hypothetical protein